ncbi:MAG: NAD(+)/NADH kinase [Coriobacteriia bacterium]|nr:NAD(+)/NADH kinase [Coriobacteriia bacterium]
MKTILIQVNEHVPEAVAANARLQAWCEEQEVACSEADKRGSGAVLSPPDLIVALGGDGTLLRAVHAAHSFEAPFLSVKFGRLGFLSGAPADRLIEAVSAALSGKVPLEYHTLLDARVYSGAEEIARCQAVNELVLRGAATHMLTTTFAINGHVFNEVSGDGLIIATATGSTAYALSAGGPVLAPSFEGAEIVPLAPHTLANRAVVTDRDDTVRIELPDPTRADVALFFDGTPLVLDGRPVSAVEVRIAPEKLSLVKFDAHNAYAVVAREFFGIEHDTEPDKTGPVPILSEPVSSGENQERAGA